MYRPFTIYIPQTPASGRPALSSSSPCAQRRAACPLDFLSSNDHMGRDGIAEAPRI